MGFDRAAREVGILGNHVFSILECKVKSSMLKLKMALDD